jgi:hypothetical protein
MTDRVEQVSDTLWEIIGSNPQPILGAEHNQPEYLQGYKSSYIWWYVLTIAHIRASVEPR